MKFSKVIRIIQYQVNIKLNDIKNMVTVITEKDSLAEKKEFVLAFLMGYVTPTMYLYIEKHWFVLDGNKRIAALQEFVNNEFSITLVNGKEVYYKDIENSCEKISIPFVQIYIDDDSEANIHEALQNTLEMFHDDKILTKNIMDNILS